MYAKRRAVSVIISNMIIIFIISITGSYLFTYSTEYFQNENSRYIGESELQKGQYQEQFKITNIWDHQNFLNITVYNYGKADIHIVDVYFNGIRVNDFIFGRSDEVLTNSLHKVGFFSPINLVTGGVYEVKIVSKRGMSSSSFWESNFTT